VRALAPLTFFLALLTAPAVAHSASEGRWRTWTGGKTADAFRIGDIKLRFRQDVDPSGLLTPVATIEKRKVTETLRGETAGSRIASAEFGVFRLGPSRTPTLLFNSYSGGAHCCFAYLAARMVDGRWQVSDLGDWDGGARLEPKDLDGDGRLELVGRDQRFLYQFDSYAGSRPPARIYELEDGKLVDISTAARFRAFYAAQLPEYRAACEKGGPGACTGYVAVAARAGDAAPALALLARSTAAARGPFKVPGRCQDESAPCPEVSFERLGDAVDRFLHDLGYLPDAAKPSGAAAS